MFRSQFGSAKLFHAVRFFNAKKARPLGDETHLFRSQQSILVTEHVVGRNRVPTKLWKTALGHKLTSVTVTQRLLFRSGTAAS